MRKINYEFKSIILADGYYDLYKKFRSSLYNSFTDMFGSFDSREVELSILGYSHYKKYNWLATNVLRDFKLLYNCGDVEIFKECARMYNAEKQRRMRLRNRVALMLDKPCLFLTLTFTDNYLSQTDDIERRVDIVRFLKQFNVQYVANKDFGTDKIYKDKKGVIRQSTKREHYHALIQLEKIDYSLYKFGGIKAKKVRLFGEETSKRLGAYIAKLTNHAIKDTTKRSAIIYSR